ncbi:MAG: 2-dehydropantoate 2-reductase [Dehalococcoidia bacterium]|nr:2-dehydropantoate 2-reductase [Dehalococcoidia bacterium]
MRFVIYGAGAVGGVIGARLVQAGHDVVLIARGDHLQAIKERGLTLESPKERTTMRVAAVGHPSEIAFRDGDVVFLCMKTQDTAAALDDLESATNLDLPIVCAQNGVENERIALRRFRRVYGMVVMLPATFVDPGVVQVGAGPVSGILDVGLYPGGADDSCATVAATLQTATFSANVYPDVMRWKYAKLLVNLANVLQAIGGLEARDSGLQARLSDEGAACFRAAGIDWAPDDEWEARREGVLQFRPVLGGQGRRGNSTWQSLARGTGSTESDFLNGEIALLGRLHGVPTPANSYLQRLANQLARERRPAGSLSAAAVARGLEEFATAQAG